MQSWKDTKNMSCKDALQCIFNLNHHDLAVFNTLQELGEHKVQTLANHLKKDRSTIYRSLQKMTQCGICEKKTYTLPNGGYYHTYRCNDIEQVRKQMQTCINEWFTQMNKKISQLENELY
ncbi:MAG: ArsR family transcriptional regulator [Candidatus Thermoplasmatota archaeon]|nr:ArsR family transcriptional regulator [Candidatus Thermoplasmatota archaeon]MBU1941680.1 ArsR family transcriptional regulator [Candidatus Thermoplasmatota archaeon]